MGDKKRVHDIYGLGENGEVYLRIRVEGNTSEIRQVTKIIDEIGLYRSVLSVADGTERLDSARGVLVQHPDCDLPKVAEGLRKVADEMDRIAGIVEAEVSGA